MRKTTKIISLLLTLVMVFAMALPATASSSSFSDVPLDHIYYEAITNLSSEGILNGMGDGKFEPEGPVTRAQFTKIICYALSMENITYSDAEKSVFTDVAPEHWAADNIVTAYEQGIINGMGDGTFAPENGVNYEQAVKMVVCALGYSSKRAEDLGGYPGGYMSIANSAKILKGIVDAKMGVVMTRGAVAQLIDNMRNADRIVDGEIAGSIRDEIDEDKKAEGQIVAVYGTELYSDTNPCYKKQIELDLGGNRADNLFDINEIEFDVDKYLGRSVIVYYEKESGSSDRIVKNIALQPRKNKEVKIDLGKICDYDDSSIEYYVNETTGETEKINYLSSSKNLLNGAFDSRTIEAILDDSNITKSGYITLISSDSDDVADVAFIKTYNLMIVRSVDLNNKKVYGKDIAGDNDYVSGIVLNVNDRTKNVSITSDGKDYPITSIRENHVLLVSESAKAIEVLVTQKSVTGKVVEMPASDKIKLHTSEKIYTLSPNADIHDGVLTVGKYITASLDAFGNVARVVFTAEASYQYGYISALEKGTMTQPKVEVMLYKASASNSTLNGIQCEFANRIKINGETYTVEKDMNEIVDLLNNHSDGVNPSITGFDGPSNDTYSQPVRYTLDSSGKINGLTTHIYDGVGEDAEEIAKLRLSHFTTSGTGIVCTVDGTTFGEYRISASTPVIYIPTNRTEGTYYSKSSSFFDKDMKYYAQFANISNTGAVSCVYLYGVHGASDSINAVITEDTLPMLVKRKSGVAVDNSTIKLELIDIMSGNTLVCYDNGISGVGALAVGDVVRVAISDNYSESLEENIKCIEALEVLADAEEVKNGTFNYGTGIYTKTQGSDSGTVSAEFRTLVGTIKSIDGKGFIVVAGYENIGSTTGEPYTATDSTPVYMYDSLALGEESNKVTISSIGEVGSYTTPGAASKVMIYTTKGSLKAIVIFK